MTDREFVLSVYPRFDDFAERCTISYFDNGAHSAWHVTDRTTMLSIGSGDSVEAAWASAAKRIREQQAKGKEVGNG